MKKKKQSKYILTNQYMRNDVGIKVHLINWLALISQNIQTRKRMSKPTRAHTHTTPWERDKQHVRHHR